MQLKTIVRQPREQYTPTNYMELSTTREATR
jgi:hypothetical protein